MPVLMIVMHQIQQVTLGGILPLPQGLTFGLFMVLTGAYVIGAAFNVLLLAGFALRSKVNTHPTRLDFLKSNWDTLAIRIFFYGYLAFYGWSVHPEFLKVVASSLGAPDWLSNWTILPVNVASSLAFGFFIDRALDSIQAAVADKPSLAWLNVFLRGRVPTYDSSVVDVQALAQRENTNPIPKE